MNVKLLTFLLLFLLVACTAAPTLPTATPTYNPYTFLPFTQKGTQATDTHTPATGPQTATLTNDAPNAVYLPFTSSSSSGQDQPTPPAPQPTPQTNRPAFNAEHRSGQTFLTWTERPDLSGEHYRLYRSLTPITAGNFTNGRLLAELGEGSSRFYVNRYHNGDYEEWESRFSDTFIIQKNGLPLPATTGLLVWTLSTADFTPNSTHGSGYYVLTVIPSGGPEIFDPQNVIGPLAESISDPLPVEITSSPGVKPGENEHVYIQYMDFASWNPTFHAPNPHNRYFGADSASPAVQAALQYAYDYVIFQPSAEMCGGKVPDKLPVYVHIHGYRNNRYGGHRVNDYPYCAYGIYPIDVSETWYFGFAQKHDYRINSDVEDGDTIVNYTEQRILRMVYDLLRRPPAGPAPDPQRVYLFGHSMGGSGAITFAQRYPNVFAAAYSGQPITNYATAGVTHEDWAADVAVKWGRPDLNLPIAISAPGDWADHLQKYNGLGVWYWQNAPYSFPAHFADNIVPLGVDHGIPDHVIVYATQGGPLYPALDSSRQPWAGVVNTADHAWSDFVGLPPSLAKVSGVPFWNLSVIRDETVPGFSHLNLNPPLPPQTPSAYNMTLMWSSSWNSWDGAPIDRADFYSISLCAVAPGSTTCGSGQKQTVDVTPRRIQHFIVTPGALYDWQNRRVSDDSIAAQGLVQADASGLITIIGFEVLPAGSRLILRPAGASSSARQVLHPPQHQ